MRTAVVKPTSRSFVKLDSATSSAAVFWRFSARFADIVAAFFLLCSPFSRVKNNLRPKYDRGSRQYFLKMKKPSGLNKK